MIAAPPARSVWHRTSSKLRNGVGLSRIWALADQGFTGVGNIAVFAYLGRAMPVEQYGAVGMMIGVHYFIAGFHRSAIVLPFTIDHREEGQEQAGASRNSAWCWLGLLCAIGLSAGLAGIALCLKALAPQAWQWAITALFLAAAISPAMLIWEFARRWLFKIGRAEIVAAASFGFAATLCLTAAAAASINPTPRSVCVGWIVASAVATAITLPFAWPRFVPLRKVRALARENRGLGGVLAATHLPYAVYSSATVVVVIGILFGPAAAGVFTAARTLTNPAISLVSAIDSTDKPRAARALANGGVGALVHSVMQTRLLIVVSTGLYLGLVAVFAAPLAKAVFHGQFPDLALPIRLLALAFFLFGLNQPSETIMIVLRAGRALLTVRSITAAATIAALFAARPWGVIGMAGAICLTQAINLALLALTERRLARSATGPAS